jgi:hypothetical protein
MAIEARWEFPSYSPYSVLNVLCQAVSWTTPINNPLIRGFNVELLVLEENRTISLGEIRENYATIPSDNYNLASSYKLRVATVGTDGRQSAFSESAAFVASPLRFDFSTSENVKLPDGRAVASQRLLFLLF